MTDPHRLHLVSSGISSSHAPHVIVQLRHPCFPGHGRNRTPNRYSAYALPSRHRGLDPSGCRASLRACLFFAPSVIPTSFLASITHPLAAQSGATKYHLGPTVAAARVHFANAPAITRSSRITRGCSSVQSVICAMRSKTSLALSAFIPSLIAKPLAT